MRILVIFSFVLFACNVNGQHAVDSKIKGSVSADNVTTLKGATIKIQSSDNSIKKEVIVDENGNFTIANLPASHRYICTASHKDYQEVTLRNFSLEEGKALKIDFKLYKEMNDEMGIETMAFLSE